MFCTKIDCSLNRVKTNITSIASIAVTTATPSGTSAANTLPKTSTSPISTSGKTKLSAVVMSLVVVVMFSFQVIAAPPTVTVAPSRWPP